MKKWTNSLLKALNDNPLQEPGKQLTAAFFILACLGKTFMPRQSLPNSLIRMVVLNPDFDSKSCPDYEFLRSCLSERYVTMKHDLILIPLLSYSVHDEVSDFLRNLYLKVAGIRDGGSPIEWMLALPLYHFLKKQSEPFGEPGLSVVWEMEQSLGLKSVQQKSHSMEE